MWVRTTAVGAGRLRPCVCAVRVCVCLIEMESELPLCGASVRARTGVRARTARVGK